MLLWSGSSDILILLKQQHELLQLWQRIATVTASNTHRHLPVHTLRHVHGHWCLIENLARLLLHILESLICYVELEISHFSKKMVESKLQI